MIILRTTYWIPHKNVTLSPWRVIPGCDTTTGLCDTVCHPCHSIKFKGSLCVHVNSLWDLEDQGPSRQSCNLPRFRERYYSIKTLWPKNRQRFMSVFSQTSSLFPPRQIRLRFQTLHVTDCPRYSLTLPINHFFIFTIKQNYIIIIKVEHT